MSESGHSAGVLFLRGFFFFFLVSFVRQVEVKNKTLGPKVEARRGSKKQDKDEDLK